ncbi:MAG: GNAT family N-acetyltransferase, partial [Myxococcota bacterium]|nr:GNAT family N-acetyltransferase [Myxococcota bacterium]
VSAGYEIQEISLDDWSACQGDIAALQEVCYEPARRDNLTEMGALLADKDSIYLKLMHLETNTLVGTAFAYPLEHTGQLSGPDADPMLGRGNTLYSADVTVHPDPRGHGLGFALKEEQIRRAMTQTRTDGEPRFAFMTGRNKVGATAAMQELNRRFGAWTVAHLAGQYGQEGGEAHYYRLPLTAPRLPEVARPPAQSATALDLTQGGHRPLGDPCEGGVGSDQLLTPYVRGAMTGGVVNKLSLCNFATPGVVRAVEVLRSMAPTGMNHLVMANSREEICDKGLRSIKFHRGDASVVISIGPVQVGTTTAAARSISLPSDHPDNWFGWPTTADPALDPDQAIADLEASLAREGADKVLAAVIEPLYARTGRSVPESFWERLRATLDRHGVPLVTVEHTTGGF